MTTFFNNLGGGRSTAKTQPFPSTKLVVKPRGAFDVMPCSQYYGVRSTNTTYACTAAWLVGRAASMSGNIAKLPVAEALCFSLARQDLFLLSKAWRVLTKTRDCDTRGRQAPA